MSSSFLFEALWAEVIEHKLVNIGPQRTGHGAQGSGHRGTGTTAVIRGLGIDWCMVESKAEKPPEGGFFFSYSISSEYQVERVKRPKFFR